MLRNIEPAYALLPWLLPLLAAASACTASGLSADAGAPIASDGGPDDGRAPDSDGGPNVDANADANAHADADAAELDASTAPLALGADIVLYGLTSDGRAVYGQGALLSAVPIAGGPAEVIGTWSTDFVRVTGPAVLVWSYTNGEHGPLALHAWTEASGAHLLVPDAVANVADVTADGSRIAFGKRAPQGSTFSIVTSALDGTGSKTVVPQTGTDAARVWFAPHGNLFVNDVSGEDEVVSFEAGSGGPLKTIAAQWSSVAVDPTGTSIFAVAADGSGALTRISDGKTTPVDTGITLSDARFDAAGANVYYVVSGALRRATVTNPIPAPVGPTGVGYVDAVSPDGKELLFSMSAGTSSEYVGAVAGGAPRALPADVANAAFSADSSYVAFYTNTAPVSPKPLAAAPVTGGAVVPMAAAAREFLPLKGTTFLVQSGDDLLTIDAAGKAATTTLTYAMGNDKTNPVNAWFLSADRKAVVYVDHAGLKATRVP